MGEMTQPTGFFIPKIVPSKELQAKLADSALEEIVLAEGAIHWSQRKYEDESSKEISFEVKATPEMERFFKEQAEELDEQMRNIERCMGDVAHALVNDDFSDKSEEEKEALRKFAFLAMRIGWNSCYQYHEKLIRR